MKTSKCLLLLLVALLAGDRVLLAQVRTAITGTVKDAGGTALARATVTEKGARSNSVFTDENGGFSIQIERGKTLVISFVGYGTQELPAENGMTVTLQASAKQNLDEVVVTALGVARKDKTLGYALTTVKGEELSRTNTINPITALQGKVAGVNINVTGSSGVQSSPFIQIRGAKVLGEAGKNENQPIFVVDGNILSNNLQGADGADLGSQLKNLNPDDYESITVLKGGAATALYGSRGLNGAVVITTKKGRAGQGLGIEVNSTYQTQNVYKSAIAYQNEYGMGGFAREGAFRPDGTQNFATRSFGPKFDGTLHPSILDANKMVPYEAKPDNWKTFFRNSQFINNHIALSGGTEKFNYRLSYSNTNAEGLMPNNSLKRDAFDFKMRGELNKVFSVDMGASYAHSTTKNWFSSGRYDWGGGQNLSFLSFYLPRNLDVAEWYKTYRKPDNTADYSNPFASAIGDPARAVINAFSKFDKNNDYRFENSVLGYLQLKAQVTPWLDLSTRGNINFYKTVNETKNYGNGTNNTGGYYGHSGSYSSNYNLLFMAHGNKTFGRDWNVDLRLFNEIYGNGLSESYSAGTSGGLSVPNQFLLGNSVDNYRNQYNPNYEFTVPSARTIGVAASANIAYKNFVNLELTSRKDWLSTLTYPSNVIGADERYGVFYPSASLSYSLYDHLADKMPLWLSSARLRASLAYVGNAGIAGPYQTNNGFIPGTIYNQNGQSVGLATEFNANVRRNLALRPQKQRSIEIGTNFGLFHELVNVDFAWYKTNTFHQLINLPGVPETGNTVYFLNAGNIQNKGWELLVNVSPIRKKNWGLDVAVNMAQNRSKIVEFGNGVKEWQLSGGYDGANVFAFEGGDFGVLTADEWASAKIDPKTGFPIIQVGPVQSATGGNAYSVQDFSYVAAEGKQKIGKVEPNLTGGVNTTLRYKNFSLYAQVDARFGGMVYSEALNYAGGRGTPEFTLQYRDKEHGGVARTDSYTGKEVWDGAIPDAVFADGEKSPINGANIGGMTFREAYEKGLVKPWKAVWYYANTYGWGTNINFNKSVSEMSWVMLREITLNYRIPASITSKLHLRDTRISVSARNIGYLYNTLNGGQNPESLQGNDPFRPYITAGIPFVRSFSATLHFSL